MTTHLLFVLAYRIEFDDGGPAEIGVLHRGTKDECERVYAAVPAINYDGPRLPKACQLGIFPDTGAGMN